MRVPGQGRRAGIFPHFRAPGASSAGNRRVERSRPADTETGRPGPLGRAGLGAPSAIGAGEPEGRRVAGRRLRSGEEEEGTEEPGWAGAGDSEQDRHGEETERPAPFNEAPLYARWQPSRTGPERTAISPLPPGPGRGRGGAEEGALPLH